MLQLERLPKALDKAVHQTLPQRSDPLLPRLQLLPRVDLRSRPLRSRHLLKVLLLLGHQDQYHVGQVIILHRIDQGRTKKDKKLMRNDHLAHHQQRIDQTDVWLLLVLLLPEGPGRDRLIPMPMLKP